MYVGGAVVGIAPNRVTPALSRSLTSLPRRSNCRPGSLCRAAARRKLSASGIGAARGDRTDRPGHADGDGGQGPRRALRLSHHYGWPGWPAAASPDDRRRRAYPGPAVLHFPWRHHRPAAHGGIAARGRPWRAGPGAGGRLAIPCRATSSSLFLDGHSHAEIRVFNPFVYRGHATLMRSVEFSSMRAGSITGCTTSCWWWTMRWRSWVAEILVTSISRSTPTRNLPTTTYSLPARWPTSWRGHSMNTGTAGWPSLPRR